MSRVKSQQELDREAQDALLAQQLMAQEQAEFQRAQQMRAQQPPAQQYPYPMPTTPNAAPPTPIIQVHPSQVISVVCPMCFAVNNVNPVNAHLQHMCGNCRRLIPAGGTDQTNATSTLHCQTCQADNVVPVSGGPFRCGRCSTVLQSTINAMPPPPVVAPQLAYIQQLHSQYPTPSSLQPVHAQYPPPSAVQQVQPQYPPPSTAQQVQPQYPAPSTVQQPAPQPRTVLQATAIDPVDSAKPRELEVRCGKCPAINSVQEDPRTPGQIQFKCGSCGALNKAQF